MGSTHTVNAVQTACGEQMDFPSLPLNIMQVAGRVGYMGHGGMNNKMEKIERKSKVSTHYCRMKSVC